MLEEKVITAEDNSCGRFVVIKPSAASVLDELLTFTSSSPECIPSLHIFASQTLKYRMASRLLAYGYLVFVGLFSARMVPGVHKCPALINLVCKSLVLW